MLTRSTISMISSSNNSLKSQSRKPPDTLQIYLEEFDHIFLVMELGELDFRKLFGTVPGTKMDEEHIMTILYNLLCAMNFVHSTNVIHRDLKPANILIDSNCNVKLCDFGLSRVMPRTSKKKKELEKFRKS